MRFHGIEMVGKFRTQAIADTTADADESEGRIVYNQLDDEIYFGDGTNWIGLLSETNPDIESGTVMWFYQNIAPTGWTVIAAIAEDTVIGVRSSGGTYASVGGVLKGDWASYSHGHTDGTLAGASHNHQWYDYQGSGVVQSWQSNGITQTQWGVNLFGITTGPMARVTNAENQAVDTDDMYTINTSVGITGDTGTDSMAGARPYAYVGILATKD